MGTNEKNGQKGGRETVKREKKLTRKEGIQEIQRMAIQRIATKDRNRELAKIRRLQKQSLGFFLSDQNKTGLYNLASRILKRKSRCPLWEERMRNEKG